MKILVLTTRLPYPLIGGDKLAVHNILKELKKLGNDITLISLYENEEDLQLAKEHNEFYSKLIAIKLDYKSACLNAAFGIFNNIPFIMNYFYSRKMQKIVNDELKYNQYDHIICHLIRTAEYVKNKNILKTILLADAFSYSYKRRLSIGRSWFDKFKIGIEFKRVLNYEKNILKYFDNAILHSQADKNFLSQYTDVGNIKIIPPGVDSNYYYFSDYSYDSNSIVFIGNMRTIANSDAVIYFGEKVFPLIKKVNPLARFIIIGAYPRPEIYKMANKVEGIEITGKIDDIREYLKTAAVSVCPVRIAAGVQNKILESMSMGVPVVTTPEGAEGLNASQNDILIANSEEEMANLILDMMKNPEKRNFYSKNSREFIEKNYSWADVGESVGKVIK